MLCNPCFPLTLAKRYQEIPLALRSSVLKSEKEALSIKELKAQQPPCLSQIKIENENDKAILAAFLNDYLVDPTC